MRERRLRLAMGLWLPLLPFAFGGLVAAWAQPQKQVLVVYSTRRDAQIVAIGERELPRILEQGLGRLDYYSEYIDDARFSDSAYQDAFRDFLLLKYKNVRFDAVIAIQDAALELVSGVRSQLFPGAPIVFFASGPVSGRIENATGLVAALTFTDTLALVADLQPQVRQIFVVSGASPADKEYERLARQQFAPFAVPIRRSRTSLACRLPNSSPGCRTCRPTRPSITCSSIVTAAARTFIRSSICRTSPPSPMRRSIAGSTLPWAEASLEEA